MANILIKLKKDSAREKLFSQFYGIIGKDDWVEVDDMDGDIHNFILNRNDLLLKEKDSKITDDANVLTEEVFKEEILKPKKKIQRDILFSKKQGMRFHN